MAREHQRLNRSSSYGVGQKRSSQSGGRGKYRQQNNQDLPEPERFYVHSAGDASLKDIIDHVFGQPLGRHRATVVTIISKDSINEPIKSHLVQALIKNNLGEFKTKNIRHESTSIDDDGHIHDSDTKEGESLDMIENQIVGHIDYKTGLVVLCLSSLMETAILRTMSDELSNKDMCREENKFPSNIVDTWPTRSHHLLKTLLLLFSMSHIVVFYNPEPEMNYNLVHLFKMLQTLMSRSQARIVDLLETIASTQVFPQQWVRLAKVSCPRALFVCDTSYLDLDLGKTELTTMKQDLEDQIYLLLNKTNIISKSATTQGQPQPLLYLPDRGDFVFFITSKDLKNLGIIRSKPPSSDSKPMNNIYADLAKLIIEADETKLEPPTSVQSTDMDNKKSTNPRYLRFGKFMNKHIVDMETNQSNHIISPRMDDLFNVILRLKSLLFPTSQLMGESGDINQITAPDERRFVDIHDSLNVEMLFSKRHCQKARSAAMDAYIRSVQLPDTTHQMALASARELYLNHARGPARDTNLNLLVEQCNRHWVESKNRDGQWESMRSKRSTHAFRGVTRTMSSFATGSPSRESDHSPVSPDDNRPNTSAKKCDLVIVRRKTGIKIVATCECGLDTNLLVKPTVGNKKLGRVDVIRLDK